MALYSRTSDTQAPPERKKEKKQGREETKRLQEVAKAFRTAADTVDGMVDIVENDEMTGGQKEDGLEEAYAKFMVQMIKIQRLMDSM